MTQKTPTPKGTIANEVQLQAWFWKYVWNTYPETHGCMWSIPNDAIGKFTNTKDVQRMQELTATGLLEGVWDLAVLWLGQYYIIETKFGNNGLTHDWIEYKADRTIKKKHRGQKEFGEKLAQHGAVRHVYRTQFEGMEVARLIFGEPAQPERLVF